MSEQMTYPQFFLMLAVIFGLFTAAAAAADLIGWLQDRRHRRTVERWERKAGLR